MATKTTKPPKAVTPNKLANMAKKAQQPSATPAHDAPARLPAVRDSAKLAWMINLAIDQNWANGPQIDTQTIDAWSEGDYALAWKWAAALVWWLQEHDVYEEDLLVPDVIVRAQIATNDSMPKAGKDDGVKKWEQPAASTEAAAKVPTVEEDFLPDATAATSTEVANPPHEREPEAPAIVDVPAAAKQIEIPGTKTEPKKASLPVLKFDSANDVADAVLAFTAFASDLKSEAKKVKDLGRATEAANMERAADRITNFILPQINRQTSIPLDKDEDLTNAVKRAVASPLRTKLQSKINSMSFATRPGDTPKDVAERKKERINEFEVIMGPLVEMMTSAVVPVVLSVAQSALDAGVQQRNRTATQLAVEAVVKVA